MKEYWLYIEPYTFVWSNKEQILMYNTLSIKGYIYDNNRFLQPFIDKLQDAKSIYSISISETELNNPMIKGFIDLIRFTFCGDLVDREICKHKPVIIYPSLNINDDVFRNTNEILNNETFGRKVINNLTSITIHLGGACPNSCAFCDEKCKQLGWCNASESELDFNKLKGFLANLTCADSIRLNFYGGDIFNCSYWNELLNELQKYSYSKSFNVDYRLCNQFAIDRLIDLKYGVNILISDLEDVMLLNKLFEKYKSVVNFVFSVDDYDSFMQSSTFIDKYDLKFTEILPYYNGDNELFFETYVFQGRDDILNSECSKKNVFTHEVLNTNYFGKLILWHDGNVYANLYGEFVGNYEDSVKELIYNEIKTGHYWRKTRDAVEPCSKCLYKYLCPSPSNYEIAIGKSNLCNIEL